MYQADTISAISTAPGESGIGIIRMSGKDALYIAQQIFKPKNGSCAADAASYKAVYGTIIAEDNNVMDEAICLIMRAPHSYTREDVVELQCHGGSMLLREILLRTYACGARPAEPGEFTKRAFLNGRIDLTQAQAVMDIIQAKTEASLTMAAGHLTGCFSRKIKNVRHNILEMIAHLEASIDFPEDDIDDIVIAEVRERIGQLHTELENLLKTAHAGRILRDGLETAIIGKPNVGKSSLLNAILREQRAIVTEVPGTTRDSIEEYADLGGIPLRIIDTAGIRATEDTVEKIGVDKARAYVERASLILALFDSSQELTAEDEEILKLIAGRDALILLNKTDLPVKLDIEGFRQRCMERQVLEISTVSENGMESLEKAIADRVYAGGMRSQEASFVDNARQAEALRQANTHLRAAYRTVEDGMSADFIVIDLRSAWEKLGEITGETVGEDIIDQIFSQFCIGK
jgi:tRNA modification GTPase